MDQPDLEMPRPEFLSAALIYLMTHYVRTGCPRLAVCVLRHMEALALHGKADPVLRDTCASLRCVWESACSANVTRH